MPVPPPPTSKGAPQGGGSRPNSITKWLVLAGCLSLCVFYLLRQRRPELPPRTAPVIETPVQSLVQHDGHWYLADGTNLFNGLLVDSDRDGNRRFRASISNGVGNGISETWYTNGQLAMVEHFKNGVSDGLREKWYENGGKMAEATIVEGRVEGVFRRWHENGKLAEQIDMKLGQPNGIGLGYYPSGFLNWRAYVTNGTEAKRETWKDNQVTEPPAASPSQR